ncbi:MAG TPA: hypothetical protein ENK48_00560 [Gammaproteobacteria bacterium]|nr:hypothetical protein [Gammaproteobacteria bacterium]
MLERAGPGQRRAPVERVIEGEVLEGAGGHHGRHDPFARARRAGVGADPFSHRGLAGIAAYLAHAAAFPGAGAPRRVDCYV